MTDLIVLCTDLIFIAKSNKRQLTDTPGGTSGPAVMPQRQGRSFHDKLKARNYRKVAFIPFDKFAIQHDVLGAGHCSFGLICG